MKKRLFQILDEMNQSDIQNNTRLVSVSTSLISADKIKQGSKISMGSDDQAVMDIFTDKYIPVLILVNKEEYDKLNKS